MLDLPVRAEREAVSSYEAERERAVQEQLARMPIKALNKAAGGRLRLGAIEAAGLRTVADIGAAGRRRLESIKGVGPQTSARAVAAALQVEDSVRGSVRIRFDIDARPLEQTALLTSLCALYVRRRRIEPMRSGLEQMMKAVEADIRSARLEYRRVRRFFATRRRKEAGRAAFERLESLLNSPATAALRSDMDQAEERLKAFRDRPPPVWDDYAQRPVVYNGLLIEVGGLSKAHEDASRGFVPEEIVSRIRAFDLDTDLLRPSLRGYQTFGAKFALVQERTILGDEMGLGKTVEALAVLCHLRSRGGVRFLVVSPAGVLVNWEHEIERHSQLECIRLHGPDRDRSARLWMQRGGVAVTTFDTLRALGPPDADIEAMVVDEAHYVKNPSAFRTQAVRTWLNRSKYALLMSGTPMQNRVEEFRTLVDHIRPDLASEIRAADGIAGADAFRQAVAPVYLRRNQADVLDELPPKIETAQWLRLDGAASDAYRRAVAEGNFMAMRRAAFMTERPEDSPKLGRLLEIVEEAADNDRKVVVFSYFRDVIQRVHAALGPLAFEPLTGSVPAPRRQELIDRFTDQRGPAVLINQIEAGGVGLNIQAASVVILTEPQWKPATEEQAIARCHRMGQIRTVEVHRLLTENSVDEQMLVILARKSALFAEYVRASAMKEATPEAVDITDQESVRQVVSQAEQERRIIELERRRLGVDV